MQLLKYGLHRSRYSVDPRRLFCSNELSKLSPCMLLILQICNWFEALFWLRCLTLRRIIFHGQVSFNLVLNSYSTGRNFT